MIVCSTTCNTNFDCFSNPKHLFPWGWQPQSSVQLHKTTLAQWYLNRSDLRI